MRHVSDAFAPSVFNRSPVLAVNDQTSRPSYASPAPDLPSYDEQATASDSDMPTTIQRCYVSHPGSMCCSTASIKRDHAQASCVVTVQTTVRVTQPGTSVAMHDMEELGWVTVQHTAADLVTAWNQQAAHPDEGPHSRHDLITNLLEHGVIVGAEKRSVNSYGHISYLVTLKDPQTKCKIRAFFKPRVLGDCDGWHRVTVEEVAYRLNLLLGMDYVPPTVYRKTADVDWHTFELGGAFMYWCDDCLELQQLPPEDWGLDPAVLLSDTRILDVLIQNSDRHAGHFLMAEHWAQGNGSGGNKWTGKMWPTLIDQAAGFRPNAHVALEHDNAFHTGPTQRISARTYLRLRFLNLATLQEAFGTLLTPQEMAEVIARRDTVLRFFDGLVEKRGYKAVVIENC